MTLRLRRFSLWSMIGMYVILKHEGRSWRRAADGASNRAELIERARLPRRVARRILREIRRRTGAREAIGDQLKRQQPKRPR